MLTTLVLMVWLAFTSKAAPPSDPEVEHVARMLTGNFSSHAQAAADPAFPDVRVTVSRIWTGRSDGPWLYIEQAMAATPAEPFRQRIHQLSRRPDGAFQSTIYTLPDAAKWIGEGARPEAFASLTPERLARMNGCEFRVRYQDDGALVGGTVGDDCPSDLDGATHATSEVKVRPGLLLIWDRGWNAAGEQVWGSRSGPYRFER